MALVKCVECRHEISDQAQTCPHCGIKGPGAQPETSWAGIAAVVISAAVVFGGIGYVLLENTSFTEQGAFSMPQSPLAPPPVVTMGEYTQVREGMSYEQVTQIIGASGQELSRTDIGGSSGAMYSWANSNGSSMSAMFQNGKLISKGQFGLK